MSRSCVLALAVLVSSCAHSAPPEVLEADVIAVVHAKKTLARDLCCYTPPALPAVIVRADLRVDDAGVDARADGAAP